MRVKLLFLILSLILSASTIVVLKRLAPLSWDAWEPATCMPVKCFCEAVDNANSIRQPANTWSSLAYIFSGFIILASTQISRAKKSSSPLSKPYGFLLGLSAIVIGVGSAFFHASLTLVGQFFDVFGMYLLTSFMLVYALKRLLRWGALMTSIMYALLNITLSLLLIEIPETRRYVFALVLIVAIVVEMLVRRSKTSNIQAKWWNVGLLLFAFAYVIWILDNLKIICAPHSLLQGHAIWHILGAIAVVLLFHYYVSEQPKIEDNRT